jgi:WbqC-like protein family
MKIAIAQPTYLPWCGYFDLIDQVDTFVILDSVQFEKQSWQHRNRIKTPTGLQWLTVPVCFRGHFGQLIQDVQIRDVQFAQKHLRAIELNYRRAKFFDDYFLQIRALLSCDESARLVDLNLRILEWLCSALSIPRKFLRSSELAVKGKRTELLANICVELGTSEYISPLGSAEYLLGEMDVMSSRGIEVAFQHYEHPEHRQLYPPFVPYASALDLLLNEGPKALGIIRSGRCPAYVPSQVALPQVAEA